MVSFIFVAASSFVVAVVVVVDRCPLFASHHGVFFSYFILLLQQNGQAIRVRQWPTYDEADVLHAAGKKTSNSCNNNPHTLYSRQDIYSSSQSLLEGQETSPRMVLLRKDNRCDRRHYHCRRCFLLPLYSRHDIYSSSQSLYQQR